jgi:hypothetical protein
MTTTEFIINKSLLEFVKNRDVKNASLTAINEMVQKIPSSFLMHSTLEQNNQRTSEKSNYEAFLPIVFVVSFLAILFLIYFINTYCLNGPKSNRFNWMCCMFRSSRELPRSVIYSTGMDTYDLQNRMDNYRKSTNSNYSYR